MILPRVKKYKENKGTFNNVIVYDEASVISAAAVELFRLYCPDLNCEKGSKPNLFFYKETFTVKGAYRLTVSDSEICICYNDYEGVRNAVASLSQLRTQDKIKCVEIFDEPDNTFRSCMLDLARGYVEIPTLKEHLVRMSLLKFNYVHLHLMDQESYALESDVIPNPDNHRLYSKKEMSELVELCKLLCLEVIPEIEIPAHAINQIKALPELGCDVIDKRKPLEIIKKYNDPRKITFTDKKSGLSLWVVCAGKETTYEIYENLIREISEIFDGQYIHIGGDELEFIHIGAYPHWDNCRYCTKKMKEENLPDKRALYYYIVRRIYDIVKSCGKRMIMWNDQLDVFNQVDIPKDIIVEYWNGQVITKEYGIHQKLLDIGFETINADARYTYVDFPNYMQEETIRNWDTYTEYNNENKLVGKIAGGEMCAWELGNPLYSFYQYSLPACMTLFADRVWNHGKVLYDDEYKKSCFSVISGMYESNVNPFAFFKEIIPPHDKNKNMLEDIDIDNISLEELTRVLYDMQMMTSQNIYGKQALGAYINCLERIKGVLD